MYSLLYMPKLNPTLKITNTIALLRAERKITQQDLAQGIGVTRATIIAIEKGSYNPSLELAVRLAGFFGQDLQSILTVETL